MTSINPVNVLKLLLRRYAALGYLEEETSVNAYERDLKDQLQSIIDAELNCEAEETPDIDDINATTQTALDDMAAEDFDPDGCPPSEASVPSSSPVTYETYLPDTKLYIPFGYKRRAIEFFRASTKNGRRPKLATIQEKFRLVKSEGLLYRWKKQVERDGIGTRPDKLDYVWDTTLEEYKAAVVRGEEVTNADLKRWALAAAKTVGLRECGGHSWITKFKKKHGIVIKPLRRRRRKSLGKGAFPPTPS